MPTGGTNRGPVALLYEEGENIVKKKLTARQTEDLMRRYVATMRDERESDLKKLRENRNTVSVEEEKPKKRLSYATRCALIAACSCVLVLALIVPVVFSKAFAPAGQKADNGRYDGGSYYSEEGLSHDSSPEKSDAPSSSVRSVSLSKHLYVALPNGCQYQYIVQANENSSGTDEISNEQRDGISMGNGAVKGVVLTGPTGLNATVYVVFDNEENALYEKSYSSTGSLYQNGDLSYSTQEDGAVLKAQAKIITDHETVYIEYEHPGQNADTFLRWVRSVLLVK